MWCSHDCVFLKLQSHITYLQGDRVIINLGMRRGNIWTTELGSKNNKCTKKNGDVFLRKLHIRDKTAENFSEIKITT